LTVIESIGEFTHTLIGTSKTLSKGEDELLHGALLKISELLDTWVNVGGSIGDSLEVVGGSNGRSTAVINEGNTRSLNLSDNSILGNANVRAVDSQAVTVIGNVSAHGSPAGVSGEGESRETTKVEVVSINFYKLVFQDTSEFVSTKGSGQQSIGRIEALLFQKLNYPGGQVSVVDGTGEVPLDDSIKFLSDALTSPGAMLRLVRARPAGEEVNAEAEATMRARDARESFMVDMSASIS
jgi:hypothetical protein